MISSFQDLTVWQHGHQFVLDIFRLTGNLPKSVQYSICNQVSRAALSITNNLAEGTGRNTTKELKQFAYISRGSLEECRNILIVCRDMNYIDGDEYTRLEESAAHISRLLNGFINSLKRRLRDQ